MNAQIPVPVLRSPEHLMAAIPFLLGFRPRASVVIVWIHSGAIALTQRVDWPELVGEQQIQEWASSVVRAARHVNAQGVVLIGYPEFHHQDQIDLSAVPLAAIGQALTGGGTEVLDAIIVLEDGWCALDAECAEGPVGVQPFDQLIAAEVSDDFMFSGWSFAADRAEVCAEFVADEGAPRVAVEALDRKASELSEMPAQDLEQWRDDVIPRLLAAFKAGSVLPREYVDLASGLTDIRVRDSVLWHVAKQLDAATSLLGLRVLVRVLPEGRRAPSATVASICAWLAGDGVRASAALDIALQDEPEYGLAQLVATALSNGLPPRTWQETMEHLSYEHCRYGLC
ncbi:MAG: DUF4192 domain-containing protein [Actinomycetota bacterium]|nr:DUF4192 domain-containing protein [Actinomycetota bacterium]MDP2288788.1 DUF4192 domain-containing protein [Actinomycetota bacterium]